MMRRRGGGPRPAGVCVGAVLAALLLAVCVRGVSAQGKVMYAQDSSLVFCSSPKAGTTSLYNWVYTSTFGGKIWGKDPPWIQEPHAPKWNKTLQVLDGPAGLTPLGLEVFRNEQVHKLAIIRDPVDRLLSGWKSKLACDDAGWKTDRGDRALMSTSLYHLAVKSGWKPPPPNSEDSRKLRGGTGKAITCMTFDMYIQLMEKIAREKKTGGLDPHFMPQKSTCFKHAPADQWTKVVTWDTEGALDGAAAVLRAAGADPLDAPPRMHRSGSDGVGLLGDPREREKLAEQVRRGHAKGGGGSGSEPPPAPASGIISKADAERERQLVSDPKVRDAIAVITREDYRVLAPYLGHSEPQLWKRDGHVGGVSVDESEGGAKPGAGGARGGGGGTGGAGGAKAGGTGGVEEGSASPKGPRGGWGAKRVDGAPIASAPSKGDKGAATSGVPNPPKGVDGQGAPSAPSKGDKGAATSGVPNPPKFDPFPTIAKGWGHIVSGWRHKKSGGGDKGKKGGHGHGESKGGGDKKAHPGGKGLANSGGGHSKGHGLGKKPSGPHNKSKGKGEGGKGKGPKKAGPQGGTKKGGGGSVHHVKKARRHLRRA